MQFFVDLKVLHMFAIFKGLNFSLSSSTLLQVVYKVYFSEGTNEVILFTGGEPIKVCDTSSPPLCLNSMNSAFCGHRLFQNFRFLKSF